MKIQETKQGAITIIKPDGPLTQMDATAFKTDTARSITANFGRVVVDMTAISFVDSLGLEAMLDLTEQLQKGGQVLKLCGANKTVREVLTLTGLSNHFEHFDDVTTALRSFL